MSDDHQDSVDGGEALPAPEAELIARRQRLTERFALSQSELGGLFYEMAIRDHLELDVLAAKAAALQSVDLELAEVEATLRQLRASSAAQ